MNSSSDQQPWKRLTGLARLRFSFQTAFTGFSWAIRTQQNLRIHLVVAVAVFVVAALLEVSRIEAVILGVCIGAVLTAELFNTAIERLTDLASPVVDERARIVKDVSAAAVLVTAVVAAMIGLTILLPPLWEDLRSLMREL